ncbi:MAG: imidazolonepropionase [Steroidobacteraceae bacterium]
MQCDRLWRGGRLATLAEGCGVGLIEDGALAVKDGRIVFVGALSQLPPDWRATEEFDLGGRLLTPGLIDCHTHLIFAGDRSHEFELRLAGADYQALAQAHGGIRATVRATRGASENELVDLATHRLRYLLEEGVTSLEIKSGYGLELDTELRMLRAARRLGREQRVDVITTLLAAHALPPEGDRSAYLDLITEQIIPRAAAERLADAVDGYCEGIAFSVPELRRVYACARSYDLPVKVHADQLSDCGGAALAAEFEALSADHLEYSSREGVEAMARAGTVAVLLPGAFFNLRERRAPPIQALREAGVRMAIATDCNPGTSPLLSLLTAMNMAAVQFGLTVDETIAGVTREAAHALGRQAQTGTLSAGKQADLAIWNVERAAELVYWIGRNPLHQRLWRGQ